MPISLKRVYSSNTGIVLDGLQPNYSISPTNANYGGSIGLANLNVSASMVEVVSVNVPSGKKLRLLSAVLGNIGTSGNLDVEIEIDGVKVLQSINSSYTSSSATLLGSGLSGVYSTAVLDLIVESNFKIRIFRAGATTANFNVTYLVVV